MKMIRVLLLCLLVSSGVLNTCAQDDRYYCRQYEIFFENGRSIFGEPICYRSDATITITGKEIFISTDSLTLRLIIIYQTQSAYKTQNDYLAAIIGQPFQIYAVHVYRDKANNYYFGCTPTKFNDRAGKIAGIVIEISNKPICK